MAKWGSYIGVMALWVLLACVPHSSQAATAVGHASAVVVGDALAARCNALSFGNIKAGSGRGSVIVSPRGFRFTLGRIKLGKEKYSRSTCDVTGQANRFYHVITPNKLTFSVQPENGKWNPALNGELVVDHIRAVSKNFPIGFSLGRFNRKGRDILYIGGRLNVPNNAHPGIYRGLIPVTMHY